VIIVEFGEVAIDQCHPKGSPNARCKTGGGNNERMEKPDTASAGSKALEV
jgi:hypothetical protein